MKQLKQLKYLTKLQEAQTQFSNRMSVLYRFSFRINFRSSNKRTKQTNLSLDIHRFLCA